jgi:hypothetical protein
MNLFYVFRCSRTLIAVDRRSSVLEAFVPWHYPRRLPVAFGGFLQQFF